MKETNELERWNARFAGEGYLFGTEPNVFLVSQRGRLKPGVKALAVSDGEGRNGVWLAQQGLEALSVDFSPTALEKARRLASQRGVTLTTVCADLAAWDWAGRQFDAVVAVFIQFAPPALRDVIFRGLKQSLVPGGLLMLEGYRPKQLEYKTGGPPYVENLYTAALLRDAFADMRVLHLAEYDAEIAEGEGHRGMSALIDLVAQKPER